MAVKKEEDSLTIEDKLRAALVPEAEQPYPIPKNWVWTYLLSGSAECLDQFRKPVNAEERALRQGTVPYYGATGQVGWIDDYLTDEELVLLGEDGAPFLERWKSKAYRIEGKAWVNNHAHILRSFYGTHGNIFLLHYLNQFDYTSFVSGTTRLKLTQAAMRRMPVPLSPLSEQQRIAEKLESLLGKIKEAKTLLDEIPEILRNLRQSVLAAAYSGRLTADWREKNPEIKAASEELRMKLASVPEEEQPYPIPEKWVWTRLETAFDEVKEKTIPTQETDLSFIGLEHLQSGGGIIGAGDSKDVKSTKTLFKAGDVLYGKLRPYLNKHALVDFEGIASTDILAFRSKGILDPRLLDRYLGLSHVVAYAQSSSQGINLPRVSPQIIKNLPIPLPSVAEQLEIVNRVESLFNKLSDLETQYREAMDLIETLPEIILSKAFRGEIVPQNPNDEPASVLLKRTIESLDKKEPIEIFIEEVVVAKDKVTVKKRIPLFDALKEANDWLSASDLLHKAGYPRDADPDTIEDFYLQLKRELKSTPPRIERERRKENDYFRAL